MAGERAVVAQMNVARLMPGDPLVAGFIDNVSRVNAIAERSEGFVWRLNDSALAVDDRVSFQWLGDDPMLAISLSVWESVEHLHHFVTRSARGGFLRRRERWFEPSDGPNYVLWTIGDSHRPTLDEGWARLRHLAEHGSSPRAFDFSSFPSSATHPSG